MEPTGYAEATLFHRASHQVRGGELVERHPWLVMATAIVLLGSTATVVPDEGSAATTTNITESFTASGVDTYILRVGSSSDLNFTSQSKIVVDAAFDKSDQLQRISAMVGTVQDYRKEDCGETDEQSVSQGFEDDDGEARAEATVRSEGGDPCFIALYGSTIEDVSAGAGYPPAEPGDATVSTGSGVGLTAEVGHDHGGFESLRTGIVYDEGTALPAESANEVYRFIVTVPAAASITVNTDLTLEGDDIQWSSTTFEGGFSFWGEDMSAAGADAPGANAWVGYGLVCGQGCGEESLEVSDPDSRIYAGMGPTWGGHYIVHTHANNGMCVDCFGPVTTVSTGWYGYTTPNDVTEATLVNAGVSTGAAALFPLITLVGAPHTGTYDFWLEHYAGTGTQDLLTVGTVGVPPP